MFLITPSLQWVSVRLVFGLPTPVYFSLVFS